MNSESINKRIFRIRKSKGLKQRDIAESLNMKESTYSQMERQGNISAQTLLDIANAIGVDVAVLLYGEEKAIQPVDKNETIIFEQKRLDLKFEEQMEAPKPVTKFEVAVETFRGFNREQQAQVYELIQKLADESK